MTRRSRTVALGLTAAVAVAVSGCSTAQTRGPVVVDGPAPQESTWVVDEDTAVESVEQEQAEGDVAYQAVCVDQSTGTRLDDGECSDVDPSVHNQGHGHGLTTALVAWYFLRGGSIFPRVGAPVTGGSYAVPAARYATGGLPRTQGTVPPGGTAAARAAAPRATAGSGGSGGSGASGSVRQGVTKGGFGGTSRSGSIGG